CPPDRQSYRCSSQPSWPDRLRARLSRRRRTTATSATMRSTLRWNASASWTCSLRSIFRPGRGRSCGRKPSRSSRPTTRPSTGRTTIVSLSPLA
ncbi:MAG: hypothetical protein AVDCRST_MAG87-974, partial [uncultured Thermomicrobiales bacterium]